MIHLEASIIVHKGFDEIPPVFRDPSSLTLWDRSVEKVEPTSDKAVGVGYTFDTIGPAKGGRKGLRSSYIITQFDRDINAVELVNSKLFKKAVWTFKFKSIEEGVEITCIIDMWLKWYYFFLSPLLKYNISAIERDLRQLKKAIEEL